jgi:hypothetical protein
VQHWLYSSENLSKIYQILSEFAFDSCQSRIIYAEKETAITGQIKNCNGYIVLNQAKNLYVQTRSVT